MAWLFRLLDRTARPLPLAITIIALLVFRTAMQTTLDRLREVSGESILDYEIGYSRDRVLEVFGNYGREGAELYQRFLTFDLAFPFLYGVFFASLLHLVFAGSRFRPLTLLPLALALFDYVEDAVLYAMLKTYPDISERVVTFSNFLTVMKFGFGALSAVAGIIAAVVLVRSWIKRA